MPVMLAYSPKPHGDVLGSANEWSHQRAEPHFPPWRGSTFAEVLVAVETGVTPPVCMSARVGRCGLMSVRTTICRRKTLIHINVDRCGRPTN